MRLATSYENPGRLGLIFPFVWRKNQQLSQQTPVQRSEQILRWHPFFLDLLQENSPIMRPICHRNSAKHLIFLGWDCCSLFWVNHVMFSIVFSVECNHLVYSRFMISVRDMIWDNVKKKTRSKLPRRFRDRTYFVLGALQLLRCPQLHLGGGFKYLLCSPLFGDDSHFDWYIFQLGWNHQLVRFIGPIFWWKDFFRFNSNKELQLFLLQAKMGEHGGTQIYMFFNWSNKVWLRVYKYTP